MFTTRNILLAVALAVLGTALAEKDWQWKERWNVAVGNYTAKLTGNNGARAVDIAEYLSGAQHTIVAYEDDTDGEIWWCDKRQTQVLRCRPWPGKYGYNALAAFCEDDEQEVDTKPAVWYDQDFRLAWAGTGRIVCGVDDWAQQGNLGDPIAYPDIAAHAWRQDTRLQVYYVAYNHDPDGPDPRGVYISVSQDDGNSWTTHMVCDSTYADGISITSEKPDDYVYLVFHCWVQGTQRVIFYRSTDRGETWSDEWYWDNARDPSISSHTDEIVVTWIHTDGDYAGHVFCAWGVDHGETGKWYPNNHNGRLLESYRFIGGDYSYDRPTVDLLRQDGRGLWKNAVVTSLMKNVSHPSPYRWVSATHFTFHHQNGDYEWSPWPEHWLNPWPSMCLANAHPSVAASDDFGPGGDRAVCVWADAYGGYAGSSGADIYGSGGYYVERPPNYEVLAPQVSHSGGGNLRLDPDGEPVYACRRGSNIHAGPAWSDTVLAPVLAGGGELCAMDVDPAGEIWTAFTRDDTLLCFVASDTTVQVFGGANGSAKLGQPSMAIYPNPYSSEYEAAVVFPVYDSAGDASRVMFAKVRSSSVVLDTVETYGTLGDTAPCISVYLTDTLVVTWQHGDSILSAELYDFGPGSAGQPPTNWENKRLVVADGRSPVSVLSEDSIIVVYWDQSTCGQTNTEVIDRGVRRVAVGADWSTSTTISENDAREKRNPDFDATTGVCAWEEKAGSCWRIMGFVRGDTTTLVAGDTDRVHPHIACDSTYFDPSSGLLTVRLLWTDWLGFEVDSAVYDTGWTRYREFEYYVWTAANGGTRSNTGAKLVQEASGDTLLSVYQGAGDKAYYAWSADGEDWFPSVVADDGTYPAICEDGTGKRWIVYWLDDRGVSGDSKVYAKYVDGTSFSPAIELYDLGGDECGPISAVGSGDATTSCVYAMFRRVKDPEPNQLILVKFNSASLWSSVEFAASQFGSDPCIATEWDAGESKDHLHLVHENTDNNEVDYTMTQNPIDPSEFTTLDIVWQDWVNLSNTEGDDSRNPVVGCDGNRVVVAWSERTTSDILVARRSCDSTYDNFQDTVDVSGTPSVSSEYPTVAVGDTVVVVWEERASATDFDIKASIEFGSSCALVSTDTKLSYPHIVFENEPSGDSAIPYAHVVYSDSSGTLDVRYDRYDIKAGSFGGGGQSGGVQELLTPMLSACRPNPFSARTQISYQFPLDGPVNLQVFDASGRSVKTLQNGLQRAGKYTVTWDGRDASGRNVANGVYFYRLDAPGFRDVKKAVVMK